MFRSAFLKRVPLFLRNLTENVLLCIVAAGVESTSKRVLETIVLDWRKILSGRIHKLYFDKMVSNCLGKDIFADLFPGLSGNISDKGSSRNA